MDYDKLIQDGVDADRMRMNSFSFGKPVSPSGAHPPAHRHSRSHSRNSSVSLPMSLSTPVSLTMNDSPPHSPTRNSITGGKRNSHHRRLSSVSTRRESADLMGVSLPSIPLSSSEDNINLGDKDSIRRRALLALEGKDSGSNFSVEIPELDAPDVPKRSFDFPSKPSFPPGMGAGYAGGLNSMMGSKRDSIGKFMASTPSSELLGTLVEEEEEEEEEIQGTAPRPVQESLAVTSPMMSMTPAPAPARPRPASLKLRPLSLSSSVQVELSTPSLTPSPHPGLKSLTLTSAQGTNAALSNNGAANKRQSLFMSSSPTPAPVSSGRRPSLNLMTDTTSAPLQPSKRSSISYVSNGEGQTMSVYGLPTPEMTPTSSTIDRRRSSVSSNGSMDLGQLGLQRGRPLSMSEQHFLFQAHETLVQRITDLERALSRQSLSSSRPVSCASDASSSSTPFEPSDEMLQLIADLKAERDELKKDVDGWRTRVADLQRQIDLHAKRVETERRDAWVARQRVGLLEVEKSSLERTVAEKTAQVEEAQARADAISQELQNSEEEVAQLKAEVARMRAVEDQCASLRAELLQETKQREDMERELEHAGLLDTPKPYDASVHPFPSAVSRNMSRTKSRGLGFRSIDSDSTFTDVESVDDNHRPELKAVQEVDEDDMTDDDGDELARYEDEDEDDEYAYPTSTSYESMMEYARSATPRLSTDSADSAPSMSISRSPSASPSPLPSPMEPMHARNASLSRVWTFPTGSATASTGPSPREEIDRFFGCLEDVDNSPPMDSKLHSVESNKNIFAQALVEYDDDLPPFVLPSNVGEIVISPESGSPQRTLDIVVEEEEEEEGQEESTNDDSYDQDEEFVGEVDEGGIKFTFNPPPSYFMDEEESSPDTSMTASTPDSVNKSAPVFEPFDEDEDEAESSFTFPQLKPLRTSPSPSGIPRLRSSSPSASMLPVSTLSSTPPKVVAPIPLRIVTSPAYFSTPPPKRAATAPTFLPQTAHVFTRYSVKGLVVHPATSAQLDFAEAECHPNYDISCFQSDSVTPRSSPAPDLKSPPVPPHPQASPSAFSPSFSSFMSPTLAARLSFQTLTNFVPSMLWSPSTGGGCFDSSMSDSSIAGSGSSDHACTSSSFVNALTSPGTKPEMPKERSYVPKERQLEKLRLRMEEERKRGRSTIGLGVEVKQAQTGVLDI